MKKAKTAVLLLCAVFIALAFSCGSTGGGSAGKGSWEVKVNGDQNNGGSSTITMAEETKEGLPAYGFKGNITNKYQYGFVNVTLNPDDAALEELKQAKAISFRFQGDGDKYAVKIVTSDIKDFAYFENQFETKDGQPITVIIPVDFLFQPSWGKPIGAKVNLDLAKFVEFQTTRNGSPGPFEFKLWDFRVHTKSVPKEKDILPKGAPKPSATPAAVAEKPIGGVLSPIDLVLADNFQYGEGYQCVFTDKRLMNGHKIVAGETYTLKITYTASRDLEDDVMVGLVDTTPQAKPRAYWGALSFKEEAKEGTPEGMTLIKKSKAGQVVTATITLKTIGDASSSSQPANALVFQTKGEGKAGSAGSGKQKAVTFKFTEFEFTKN